LLVVACCLVWLASIEIWTANLTVTVIEIDAFACASCFVMMLYDIPRKQKQTGD
jgi:hypothetical protein